MKQVEKDSGSNDLKNQAKKQEILLENDKLKGLIDKTTELKEDIEMLEQQKQGYLASEGGEIEK